MKWLILVLASVMAMDAMASPCDGVDRSLSEARKTELAPSIAKQMKVQSADVLQSFRYRGWTIIYVDTHAADEAYLFFAGDPLKSKYVTFWSGAATIYEGPEIERWVRKDAKGIPRKLAACFAFHVTKARDE